MEDSESWKSVAQTTVNGVRLLFDSVLRVGSKYSQVIDSSVTGVLLFDSESWKAVAPTTVTSVRLLFDSVLGVGSKYSQLIDSSVTGVLLFDSVLGVGSKYSQSELLIAVETGGIFEKGACGGE